MSNLSNGGAILFHRGDTEFAVTSCCFPQGEEGGPTLVEAATQNKKSGRESISFDRLYFSRQYRLLYIIKT
jgi:hypothetical protein